MSELQPKNMAKIEKANKERIALNRRIHNDWVAFSKTAAYKDLQEYMGSNHDLLVGYAKERVMPSPVGKGEQLIIDGETSSSLLQNARGIDIVRTYVEEHVNVTT